MKRQLQFIFLIYAILLFVASIFPIFGNFSEIKLGWLFELQLDNLIHFCVFLSFYLLLIIISKNSKTTVTAYNLSIIFIIMQSLAVTTEIVQLFLSYRTFNIIDLISNISGIIAGTVIYWVYQLIWQNNSKAYR